MFAAEEVKGEKFMAVKPWIGAVIPPSNPKAVNKSPPDKKFKLDYVFGYRTYDARQNL